jgi:hypothetical protein
MLTQIKLNHSCLLIPLQIQISVTIFLIESHMLTFFPRWNSGLDLALIMMAKRSCGKASCFHAAPKSLHLEGGAHITFMQELVTGTVTFLFPFQQISSIMMTSTDKWQAYVQASQPWRDCLNWICIILQFLFHVALDLADGWFQILYLSIPSPPTQGCFDPSHKTYGIYFLRHSIRDQVGHVPRPRLARSASSALRATHLSC